MAFEGSTDRARSEIGSSSFVNGFEDGLIGAEIGETRMLRLPPKAIPMRRVRKGSGVTVTAMASTPRIPLELTDEYVKGLELDLSTVDEYKQYVFDMLMEDEQNTHDSNAQIDILAKVVENSEFKEPPADMVTRYYDRIKANMSSYAAMYGYDLESFMAATGSSEEQVQESGTGRP